MRTYRAVYRVPQHVGAGGHCGVARQCHQSCAFWVLGRAGRRQARSDEISRVILYSGEMELGCRFRSSHPGFSGAVMNCLVNGTAMQHY